MTTHCDPPSEAKLDAIYYRHAGSMALARRVSFNARRRVCRLFMEVMRPLPADRVLDVGVSDDVTVESNMLEQVYPHPQSLSCAGLSNGAAVMSAYPKVSYAQIVPHQPLPFEDNEFEIVYSNAVLEHAGSHEQQRFFLSELCRVARRRFVVVPNPRFPIELHTSIPLLHYLPKRLFRRLLDGTRFDFWAHEENLNYVSASRLRELWPGPAPVIRYSGIRLGVFSSNIAAYNY